MKYIVPILVGAVIGYITNWLAIKMLFRPYTEKRFLGIPIPFTPGLIPKEMNRIAKSIGDTIGEYLLSPEIVSNALSGEDTKGQIDNWMEGVIEKLKQNREPIKNIIAKIAGKSYNDISSLINIKITGFICSAVQKAELRDYIKKILKNLIFENHDDSFYTLLKYKLCAFLRGFSYSEDLKKNIEDAIDKKLTELSENTKSLNEMIPESIVNIIKSYIIEHDEDIVKSLREAIESPVMKRRIKSLISEIAEQNMSKVITIFMSPDSIADKVFESIEKYIDNPSNSKGIVMIFTTIIDKLMQNDVSSLFLKISPGLKEESINNISDIILGFIRNEKNQDRFTALIEEKIRDISPDAKESIMEIIGGIMDNTLESPKFSEYCAAMVEDAMDWIMNQPACNLIKDADRVMIDGFTGLINDLFDGFVNNRLPYLVQLLNIPKIVEDRINNFDVVFAEKIIIDIANKELKAITWLGALLGGIMGILTPLIQLLY